MASSKSLRTLATSGFPWMNALPASAPEYAGGVVGAAPLNAPAPLPLSASGLFGIVTKVLQWMHLLHCYRVVDCESNQFVGAGSILGHLL